MKPMETLVLFQNRYWQQLGCCHSHNSELFINCSPISSVASCIAISLSLSTPLYSPSNNLNSKLLRKLQVPPLLGMEYISKFPKGNSREINKVLSISIYIVVCLRQSWSFGSFHTHLYPPSPDPPVYITCFVRLMSVCEVVLGHQHRLPNSLRKPSSECRSFTGDWALRSSQGPRAWSIKDWATMEPPPLHLFELHHHSDCVLK